MGGTNQLNNVAMDWDGFLRTYRDCENPRGLSIHVSRYPYVYGRVSQWPSERTSTGSCRREHRRTIRRKHLPNMRRITPIVIAQWNNDVPQLMNL